MVSETNKTYLIAKHMTMRRERLVNKSLIAAPNFTKNKAAKPKLKMHQTKNGNQWY